MIEGSGLFRALVERASDLALLADAEGRLLYVSPVAARVFGYDPGEVEQSIGFDFMHPDDVAARQEGWANLVQSPTGTMQLSRFRVRDASGSWRHVEERATNLIDDPAVGGVAVSLRDVTEGVEADEALAASHHELERLAAAQQRLLERYRTAVEAAGLGVWEFEPDTGVVVWTADPELAERVAAAGYVPGQQDIDDLRQLIHPEDVDDWWATVRRALERGEPFSTEYRIQLPEGERRWQVVGRTVAHGGQRRMFGTFRDVTEVRAGEEQLRRQQEELARVERFASMGELAGGLAHDVSNLMTVVAGRADLLALRLGEDDEDVRELAETARRGRQLLDRVMSFAHRTAQPPGATDPIGAVRAFVASAPQLLGTRVAVDVVLDDHCPAVPMSPSDLDQVLLNLCTNAGRAMPEGGRLRIALARDDAPAETEVGAAGPWVRLDVEDEGVGIDPELLPRVFEPFVTTGSRRGGTGLGLAIVYRIVTDVGGHVAIDSTPGRGTTVRVILPGVSDAA